MLFVLFQFLPVTEPFENIPVSVTTTVSATVVSPVSVAEPAENFITQIICEELVPQTGIAFAPDTNCPLTCIQYSDQSCPPATSWLWEFQDGTPATSTEQHPPPVCYQKPGTYTVFLTVTNSGGTSTGIQQVTIEESCNEWFIPNVITPDDDGKNDSFLVKGLPENFNLIIFNRWGNEIFQTSDASMPWRGKDKNGQAVEDGVYFYQLQALSGSNKGNYAGTVMVLSGN